MNNNTPPPRLPLWRKGLLALIVVAVILCVANVHHKFRWTSARWTMDLLTLLGAGLAGMLLAAFVVKGPRWMLCSRQAWKSYGWTLLGAVSLVVLFYSEESWRGKRQWAQLQAELRARGESLDPASLLPPAVPPEQDFSQVPLLAPLLTFTNDPRSGLPFIRSDATNQQIFRLGHIYIPNRWHYPRASAPRWPTGADTDLPYWSTNTFPRPDADAPVPSTQEEAARQLLALFEPDRPALDEVIAYSHRPHLRLPYQPALHTMTDTVFLDRNQWASLHMVQTVSALHRLVLVLQLRASAGLVLGQTEQAFTDTQTALRIVRLASQTPLPLPRYSWPHHRQMLAIALQPLWEGLAHRRWTDAQLAAFQEQLSGWNYLDQLPRSMHAICLDHIHFINSLAPITPPARDLQLKDTDQQRVLTWFRRIYPIGWSYQNQVAVYRAFERFAAASQQQPRRLDPKYKWKELTTLSPDPFAMVFLTPIMVEMIHGTTERFAAQQTALNLARVACGLERHRLAHGAFPESLEALAPSSGASLPRDVFTGQPPLYRRASPEQYTLYSVGLDLKDDQGAPREVKPHLHDHASSSAIPTWECSPADWVWPASPGN